MKGNKQLIIGRKAVLDLLQSGQDFERIYLQNQLPAEIRSDLLQRARKVDIPVQFVPRVKLDKLSRGNHQGVIGLSSLVEYQDIEALIASFFDQGREPRIAILDGITDVRNFGAIARSAEVLGIDAILIGQKNSAPVNDIAVKTSAGALLRLPLCRSQRLTESLQNLKALGLRLVLARATAPVPIHETELSGPLGIILGSEGEGVHPALAALADLEFSIPQHGETESLNVSVAAGIVFYEILRQGKTMSNSLR